MFLHRLLEEQGRRRLAVSRTGRHGRATERAITDPYPVTGIDRAISGSGSARKRCVIATWSWPGARSRSGCRSRAMAGRALPDQRPGRLRAPPPAAAGKRQVLLLGAGLIGCEFANDLSSGGYQLDVVAPASRSAGPAPPGRGKGRAGRPGRPRRALPPGAGAGQPEEGRRGAGSASFGWRGDSLRPGGLRRRPASAHQLAFAAGLAVNRGIVVDRSLRTSTPTSTRWATAPKWAASTCSM